MNEFYLNLPSNTYRGPSSQEHNSTSEFRVPLPKDIRLVGEYEVALVELLYPYSFDNIRHQFEKFTYTNQIILHEKSTADIENIFIWPSHYDDIDQLLASLHAEFTHVAVKNNKWKNVLGLNFDAVKQRVVFKVKHGYEVILSEHLAYMFGFVDKLLDGKNIAKFRPDMRGGMDSLHVLCDLCEPQIVGDSMDPLLRIIPVSGKYGDVIHRVFVAPHYINVLVKEFSSVGISIKTDRNENVPFTFGKTVAKLHFRRKLLI